MTKKKESSKMDWVRFGAGMLGAAAFFTFWMTILFVSLATPLGVILLGVTALLGGNSAFLAQKNFSEGKERSAETADNIAKSLQNVSNSVANLEQHITKKPLANNGPAAIPTATSLSIKEIPSLAKQ